MLGAFIIMLVLYYIIGLLILLILRLVIKTKREFKGIFKVVIATVSFILANYVTYQYYTNSVLYKQSDDNTAIRGIILSEKVILSQYRLIGEKDYLIFKMNEYTRSDREHESILVIVK